MAAGGTLLSKPCVGGGPVIENGVDRPAAWSASDSGGFGPSLCRLSWPRVTGVEDVASVGNRGGGAGIVGGANIWFIVGGSGPGVKCRADGPTSGVVVWGSAGPPGYMGMMSGVRSTLEEGSPGMPRPYPMETGVCTGRGAVLVSGGMAWKPPRLESETLERLVDRGVAMLPILPRILSAIASATDTASLASERKHSISITTSTTRNILLINRT